MTYVYLLESTRTPKSRYTGKTANLRLRLADHNAGRSVYTAKDRPWRLITYHAFEEPTKAAAFERYLKSGSGRTFASRHFW